MTLPTSNEAQAKSAEATAPAPTRVIVVVPRRERGVHEYLQRSLASVKDVEVVLDRRAAVVTREDDRRRGPSKNSERKLLICSLVHCPIEPPAAPPSPPSADSPETGHRRTMLWPELRLEHL
jgi:hypothetical protein